MNHRLSPTPYPDVNHILQELLKNIQGVLGSHLVGMYLDGSLVSGDFDQDSDIDFVVVTDEAVSGDLFLALQAMHDRISMLDSVWAVQLEGSYMSLQALRRYDPAQALHPNIERGNGERLKMVNHDAAWTIHRHVLRERGITLAGPSPKTLIDPVTPDDLRQAMRPLLNGWAAHILHNPQEMKKRGYQSYIVLSLCRILYTLQYGDVVSKPTAAGWVKKYWGGRWEGLINRAWEGRHNPQQPAEKDDIEQTQALIRYALSFEDGKGYEVIWR
jgi:hypothetical protein